MIALWDLGNVLVRWDPEKILSMLGYPSHQTDFIRDRLFGHPDWLDLDRGVTTEDLVARRLVEESDLTLDEALRCFSVVRESLVDIPDSVSLVEQMAAAGIDMYVLSNMGYDNAELLQQRAYFSHFKGVVISAHEQLIKPDPAVYQVVLNRYELAAETVFFIDDTEKNINAATAQGMQGLVFRGSAECYATIRGVFDLSSV